MSEADATKWNGRYAERSANAHPTTSWLDAFDSALPRAGASLDVGAGSGPMACWAAARGLDALAIDVSARGLELARACATATGVEIRTRVVDLDTDPLPGDEAFALVTWFHFLRPELFAESRAVVAPGGLIASEHHTTTNLERHAHPSRRWLVEPGIMGSRARAAGWTVVHEAEGWVDDRHVVRVLARL